MPTPLTSENLADFIRRQEALHAKDASLEKKDLQTLSSAYASVLAAFQRDPDPERFGQYLKDDIRDAAEMIALQGRQSYVSKETKRYFWKTYEAYRNVRTEFGI